MARIALVTGGTRGIGAAISRTLTQAGVRVAASYAGNDEAVRRLLAHAPVAVDAEPAPGDPHAKANALLQAHLSRAPLPGGGASGELAADQRRVVREAARLLQAAVDVVALSWGVPDPEWRSTPARRISNISYMQCAAAEVAPPSYGARSLSNCVR